MNTAELRAQLPPFTAFSSVEQPLVSDYYQHYTIDFAAQGVATKQTIGIFQAANETLVGQAFFAPEAQTNTLLVHGYMDHIGLYGPMIKYLLNNRSNVFIMDLAGHGLSTGTQCSIDSFFDYTTALSAFIRHCQRRYDSLPWQLFGQSMGGALAMSLHFLGGHVFTKTVLLAPLVRPAQWVWIRQFHSLFAPMMLTMPRVFHNSSHNTDFNQFVARHDPLQTRQIPMQWVNAWRDWKRWFLNQPLQEAPVLIVQGTDDSTVDWHYGLKRIPLLFPNAEIYIIDDARHHLVNEAEPYATQLFNTIDEYLHNDMTII